MPELRQYNTALSGATLIRVSLIKAGTSDFATGSDWTPGAGDVKVSKDGAAQANIATLPSYSEGSWEFTLSGAELSAKQIRVIAIDAAINSFDLTVETFGHASAMYPQIYNAGNAAAVSTFVAGGAVNATQLAGQEITAAAGVTFPASIASPTNITGGTIATVTNLTNAPTNGDFTATMKTSITTAATAATPTVAATVSAASIRSALGLDSANLSTLLNQIIDTQDAPGTDWEA